MAMGYTVAVPTILDIFSSCTSHHKPLFEFLNNEEVNVLNYLIDVIIPESSEKHNTTDHFLTKFTDRMLQNVSTENEQIEFRKGCKIFISKFEKMFGKGIASGVIKEYELFLEKYMRLSDNEEKEILTLVNKNIKDINEEDKEDFYLYKFILITKKHSLLGYFTSEEIMINKLNYKSVPGQYIGCVGK